MYDMCRTCVMWLRPYPMNSWWNSTPFWPLTLVYSSKWSKVTQSCVNHVYDMCRTRVTCLGPCPLDSWQNSTPFWPHTLVYSSKGSKVTQPFVNHVYDMCRTCVTCLGPCPLNSWQNSTPFWPLTCPCSSSSSRVSNRHVLTRGRHISNVWDHVHWIPGEILSSFDQVLKLEDNRELVQD